MPSVLPKVAGRRVQGKVPELRAQLNIELIVTKITQMPGDASPHRGKALQEDPWTFFNGIRRTQRDSVAAARVCGESGAT